MTYAGNAAAYQNVDPQPSSTWVYAKVNTAQAMLVHSASTCTEMQAAVKNANRPRQNTGMVYATNLAIGAPQSAYPLIGHSCWERWMPSTSSAPCHCADDRGPCHALNAYMLFLKAPHNRRMTTEPYHALPGISPRGGSSNSCAGEGRCSP